MKVVTNCYIVKLISKLIIKNQDGLWIRSLTIKLIPELCPEYSSVSFVYSKIVYHSYGKNHTWDGMSWLFVKTTLPEIV